MTTPTPEQEQIAKRIRYFQSELNTLLNDAARAGITVDINTQSVQTVYGPRRLLDITTVIITKV